MEVNLFSMSIEKHKTLSFFKLLTPLTVLFALGVVIVVGITTPDADDLKQVPTYLPRPVEVVREDLAARLNVVPNDIEVVDVKEEVWPDTCLGLPAPELCAPGETPGYRIILRVLGQEYRYHTDKGDTFRFAGPGDIPQRP